MQVTAAIERSGHPMGHGAHRRGARRLDPRAARRARSVTSLTHPPDRPLGSVACSSQTSTRSATRSTLSALCAAVPLLTLFVLLGGLRIEGLGRRADLARSWRSLVAIVLFEMPVGQALLSGTEGAAFGFFPILWIVINAIWVYNLTVASGHFDVLRRSFEKVSPDQRIQAIIIAFCFGALLEALAGFGTPVAITVVMLMALGFQPIKAAAVALIANTAPVAFGALATPIVTLADGHLRRQQRPRPDRRHARRDGRPADPDPGRLRAAGPGVRRRRQAWRARRPGCRRWSAASRSALAQFVAANYISVPLADIVAALVAAAAVVLLLRVWQPAEVLGRRAGRARPARAPACAGRRRTRTAAGESADAAAPTGPDGRRHDSGAEVARAYAPYLVIIAIFSITNITAVKEVLAEEPLTYAFQWPGLDVRQPGGRAARLDDVQLQLAARRRHPDDLRGHHHRA